MEIKVMKMKIKLFSIQEIVGIFAVGVAAFCMWSMYVLTDGLLVTVLFCSVNGSIWEQLKPLLLCYFLYGGYELFSSKPYFRRFVVAKAFGVYAVLAVFIVLCHLLPYAQNIFIKCIVCAVSLTAGFLVSRRITLMERDLGDMFTVACLMLLLVFVMFVSFTAYPPRLELFRDPNTSMFGIIPDYIDVGAFVLG